MKSGDKAIVEVPDGALDAHTWDSAMKEWKDFIRELNGKEVTVEQFFDYHIDLNGQGVPGWDTASGSTKDWKWIPEMWLKPISITTSCDCSIKDLMWVGHKCGRKAPVDKR